jgi:hypothetical protein
MKAIVHEGRTFFVEGNDEKDIQEKAAIEIKNMGWDVTNAWIEELPEKDKEYEIERERKIRDAVDEILSWI